MNWRSKKILHFFELSRFRNIPGKTLLLKIIRRVYSIWEMGNQCECVCVWNKSIKRQFFIFLLFTSFSTFLFCFCFFFLKCLPVFFCEREERERDTHCTTTFFWSYIKYRKVWCVCSCVCVEEDEREFQNIFK